MKVRNSNFEFLRIISMLMIIAHHYSVHGGFEVVYGIHLNNMILDFLYLGGKIGVVLFIFISGYHLIHSNMTISKALRLEFQILFYSILFAIIFYFISYNGSTKLTIQEIREACFPILHNQYWFATFYIILYLSVPFINKLLLSLKQEEFIHFLILQFILVTIIPTFMGSSPGLSSILSFIFFYSIGAYLRLFPIHIKRKTCPVAAFLLYLFLFLITLFFEYLASFDPSYAKYIYHFASENSLFVLFCSIAIFEFFRDLKVQNYSWINMVASTTFGIYLIHDNRYVRQFLWTYFFKNANFYQSKFLLGHALISILLVFIICSIIEFTRKMIIKKILLPTFAKKHQ